MSDTHSLLTTAITDADSLLLDARANSVRYADDVGFWSDNLAPLVAIITGRDFDDEFEQVAESLESNLAFGDDDNVNLLSSDITLAISKVADSEIERIADNWASLDDEITWHESLSPFQMLGLLVDYSRTAIENSLQMAIHSYH